MGLWSWFARRRKRATTAGRPASAAAIEPKEQEPLTPEQVADLKAAWAELAEAAKESAATGFHACSRGGKPWQEDPAAVRTVAALLRRVDAEDAPTRGVSFTGRRQLLEELARDWAPPLHLSPITSDMDLAKTWLRDLPATGIEGLVFKGAQPYEAARIWLKLKHKDLWDVICAAVIGSDAQPQAIIVGLPMGGELKIVGRSTVLSTKVGRELGRHLHPAGPGHPWPEEIGESSLNRFSKDKGPRAADLGRTSRGRGLGRRRLVRHILSAPRYLEACQAGPGPCRGQGFR